jgi:hypothetical protein
MTAGYTVTVRTGRGEPLVLTNVSASPSSWHEGDAFSNVLSWAEFGVAMHERDHPVADRRARRTVLVAGPDGALLFAASVSARCRGLALMQVRRSVPCAQRAHILAGSGG